MFIGSGTLCLFRCVLSNCHSDLERANGRVSDHERRLLAPDESASSPLAHFDVAPGDDCRSFLGILGSIIFILYVLEIKDQKDVCVFQFLDSGLVVTSSDDGTVKLWDITKGVFVRDLVKLSTGGNGGCIWR